MATRFNSCVIGSTQLAIECCQIITENGISVDCVFTDDFAFSNWAALQEIPVNGTSHFCKCPSGFFAKFDLLFSIVNDVIIPKRILEASNLPINYHNSPLPKYAGANATHWALINGERAYGVTWHVMDKKVDSGDILTCEAFPLTDSDDVVTVNLMCSDAAKRCVKRLCQSIISGSVLRIQQLPDPCTKHFVADRPSAFCLLPFHHSATSVRDFFRGTCTLGKIPQINALGLPKVYFPPYDEVLIVRSLEILRTSSNSKPGYVVGIGDGIQVATAGKDVMITELVRMDGMPVAKPEKDAFPLINKSYISLPTAYEKDSLIFLMSNLAAKNENKWIKNQLHFEFEPPLWWPYQTQVVDQNATTTFTDKLSYDIHPVTTFNAKAIAMFQKEFSELPIEIAVLAAFVTFMLALSPTLSGSLDVYCNNLPREHKQFLLEAHSLTLELSSDKSFKDCLDTIGAFLKSAVCGKLVNGHRQDLVAADVYLRHPGIISQPKNTIAVSAIEASSGSFESLHSYLGHDVVIVTEVEDNNVSLLASVRCSRAHKYSFHRVDEDFSSFLDSCCVNILLPLKNHPLCNSNSLTRISQALTGNQIEIPYKIVHEPIELQAQKYPFVTAVVDEHGTHTYHDVLKRSNDIAAVLLQKLQSKSGLRVALLLRRTWEAVAAMLAILKVGGCFILLEPNHPSKVLLSILDSSQASVVLLDEMRDLNEYGIETLFAQQKPQVVSLDLVPETSQELQLCQSASADDPAIIIYTSGSTGSPKGVILKHSSLCNYMTNLIRVFKLQCTSNTAGTIDVREYSLANTSFNFDGSLHEMIPILWIGGTLIFHPPSPGEQSRCKGFYRYTTFLFSQPTKLTLFDPSLFPSLRTLSVGGEAFSLELLKPWFTPERSIWNVYGPCEATVGSTLGKIEDLVHLGAPVSNVVVKVLNNFKEPVPPGVPGEVHIGGAGVSLGYTDHTLNGEAFWHDSSGNWWYKTRDLAFLDDNFHLHFLSRIPKDRQAKLHSIRLELSGIENTLRQLPLVQFAHVQVDEVSNKVKRLVAYVAPESLNSAQIRDALKKELPSYSIPSIITPVSFSSIRFTPSGKLDLVKTDKCFHPPASPADELEKIVLELFSKLLGVKEEFTFGMDSDFIEFGGDSVIIIHLASELSSALNCQVTADLINKMRTPGKLVEALRNEHFFNADMIPVSNHTDMVSKNSVSFTTGKRTMSFFQEALASANSLALGPAYNAVFVLQLLGEVNHLLLATAVDRVLSILYAAYNDKTRRELTHQYSICHIHLADFSSEKALSVALMEIQIDAVTPIDFNSCPYRCRIYNIDRHCSLIGIVAHHLVFDHKSWFNFEKCLEHAYKYPSSPFPEELSIPYSKFIVHEEALYNKSQGQSWRFWKTYLEHSISFVTFPTSFRRVSPIKYYGKTLKITMPSEIGMNVNDSCSTFGVRPMSFFLAAYGLLISKLSNAHSFVVGVSINQRSTIVLERIIGMVLTVLPCCFHRDGFDGSFVDLMHSISKWYWKAVEYCHIPFLDLVKLWGGESNNSHTPQFLYNFVAEKSLSTVNFGSGIRIQTIDVETYTAKAELLLDIHQCSGGYECIWEYNSTLFSEEAVSKIAFEYIDLVSFCLKNAYSKLASHKAFVPELQFYESLAVSTPQSSTMQPLTQHQKTIFREYLTTSVDLQGCFHCRLSLRIDSSTKFSHVCRILESFPLLKSVIVERDNDVFLTDANTINVCAHTETAKSTDEAEALKYRLWLWPFDIHTGPLFRCAVISHTYSNHLEVFFVFHQVLLDEGSLCTFAKQFIASINERTSIPSELPSLHSPSGTFGSSKNVQLGSFTCDRLLPSLMTDGFDSLQLFKPAVAEQEIVLPTHSTEDFVAHCCCLTALFLSKLYGMQHVHFGLLCPVLLGGTCLQADECIVPVCFEVKPNVIVADMTQEFKKLLPQLLSFVADSSYSYWSMQEQLNPFASYLNPMHEVLLCIFPHSGTLEVASWRYPRPFKLCLSFCHQNEVATLTSVLSAQQIYSAEGCFKELLFHFKSLHCRETHLTVKELLSQISIPASILHGVKSSQKSELMSMIESISYKYSVAYCDVRSCCFYTFHEILNLSKSLASKVKTTQQKQALTSNGVIAVLVSGGCILPVCILASVMCQQTFTVLDPAEKPNGLREKLLAVPVSLVLVDVETLKVLQQLLLLCHPSSFQCLLVELHSEAITVPVEPNDMHPATHHDKQYFPDNFCMSEAAFVVFTSGSTGKPKPTPVLCKSLVNFLQWFKDCFVNCHSLRWLQFSGVSFDALVAEVLGQFVCGGSLVLIESQRKLDLSYTLSVMNHFSTEAVNFVPTVLSLMLKSDRFSSKYLPQLTHVFSTGEKLRVELCSKFFRHFPPEVGEVLLHNWGGPSECCIAIAHCVVNEQPCLSVVPYGYPAPETEIHVVGMNSFEPVPLGFPGEVVVTGIPVFKGYLSKVSPHPLSTHNDKLWYRTGDIGYVNSGGQLVFLCRYDHQVKVSGQRIDLQGLKKLLLGLSLPYLIDVILDVIEVNGLNQLLCFPLVTNVKDINEETMQHHLNAYLPDKYVPYVVQCMERYPLLASDKVNLKELRRIAEIKMHKRLERSSSSTAFSSSSVRDLLKAIQEVHPLGQLNNLQLSLDSLGFDSLRKAQLHQKLQDMDYSISMSSLLASKSLLDLAARLTSHYIQTPLKPSTRSLHEPDVTAIVSMHIQVPGASCCEDFWMLITDKKETISHGLLSHPFTGSELQKAKPSSKYVASRGILQNQNLFDASLFGSSPEEATLMDPQQRLLLQAVWTALEIAGYDPAKFADEMNVGLFAGVEFPSYLFNILSSDTVRAHFTREEIVWAILRDNVALRIGKQLDFRGPCITFANNCSTFLVALHHANRSLLSHECDIAVVAAATISGHSSGYITSDRDIYSKDGQCRPFSASATGTVMSDGLAVIVLRRATDAKRAGDDIVCLVRGTSVGSDGALTKERQLEPSTEGQAMTLGEVFQISGVDPHSIGLVEAHGTGTKVGDKVELESLTSVFECATNASGRKCPIGSVKGNIGHIGVAAAGPSIIKAAMAVKLSKLPPTINCSDPIHDIKQSPFFVNTELKEWKETAQPRRALVHSVGAMGSNTAAILEEYFGDSGDDLLVDEQYQHYPICISANSEFSLQKICYNLRNHLLQNPDIPLRCLAYTLLFCRKFLPLRICTVAETATELASWLSTVSLHDANSSHTTSSSCVMFAGQGTIVDLSVFAYFARILPGFRDVVSRHFNFLEEKFSHELENVSLSSLLGGNDSFSDVFCQCVLRPPIQQCLVVISQLAVYRSLCSLGFHGDCFIGHSLGEYTAACVAGAYSEEAVIKVVFERGLLIEKHSPRGKMLALHMSGEDAANLCSNYAGLEVVCLNSPLHCVVAGPPEAVDSVSAYLSSKGEKCRTLQVDYAYHHSSMKLVQTQFENVVSLPSQDLQRSLITTLSGYCQMHHPGARIATAYWSKHLVTPCDFKTVHKVLQRENMHTNTLFVEICLAPSLKVFLGAMDSGMTSQCANLSLSPKDKFEKSTISSLSCLWKTGADLFLHKLPIFTNSIKLKLPTYPFDQKEYWIPLSPQTAASLHTTNLKANKSDKPTVDKVMEIIRGFCGPDYVSKGSLPDDSLTLMALQNRLYQLFGVDVSKLVNSQANPKEIADHVVAEAAKEKHAVVPEHEVVKLLSPATDTARPSLFIINAVDRKLHSFTALANLLSPHYQVYGVYTSTAALDFDDIQRIANFYLSHIKKVKQSGPYLIGGFSFGAWVAHALVSKLITLNDTVELLFMIDPPDFDYRLLGDSTSETFPHHLYSVISLGLESVRSFTRNPLQKTIVQYGRRFEVETNLLLRYMQQSSNCLSLPTAIMLAKERVERMSTHDDLSSNDYWSRWCSTELLQVHLIPAHHGTCFSALNCHHIGQILLERLQPQCSWPLVVKEVPVCSAHEVAGHWKLKNFALRPNAPMKILDDSYLKQLTSNSLLNFSAEGDYTCMLPRLHCLITQVPGIEDFIVVNSCGTLHALSMPGAFVCEVALSYYVEHQQSRKIAVNLAADESGHLIFLTSWFELIWSQRQ